MIDKCEEKIEKDRRFTHWKARKRSDYANLMFNVSGD